MLNVLEEATLLFSKMLGISPNAVSNSISKELRATLIILRKKERVLKWRACIHKDLNMTDSLHLKLCTPFIFLLFTSMSPLLPRFAPPIHVLPFSSHPIPPPPLSLTCPRCVKRSCCFADLRKKFFLGVRERQIAHNAWKQPNLLRALRSLSPWKPASSICSCSERSQAKSLCWNNNANDNIDCTMLHRLQLHLGPISKRGVFHKILQTRKKNGLKNFIKS